MHRKKLLTELYHYSSSPLITDEERALLPRFTTFIEGNSTCFDRSREGHITSSSWIMNHDATAVLLTHHRKLNEWIQLGGHNDGIANCLEVALKEAQEESGIVNFSCVIPAIFDIDIHALSNSYGCKYHYDIRYLLQAAPHSTYIISSESYALAWVPFKEVSNYTRERSVLRMNDKLVGLIQTSSL